VEGFAHRDLPVFSVQYHPEASPGPHDSHYLFREFLARMETRRAARLGWGAHEVNAGRSVADEVHA